MKGFVVYPTYRIIDDKAYVYLFGRLENGESFLTINEFKPYFYIRKKDLEKARSLKTEAKFDAEEVPMKNFYGEPAAKITLDLPKDVPGLRDEFSKTDIMTYEADIRFVYRFMIDNNISGTMDISGKYKKGNLVDRIYEDPELKGCDFRPELKVMSIDIETSMDAKDIYCISLYSKDISKVLIVSDKKLKHSESLASEKEMLERFKEIIHEEDPDIITGWNLIDFDLKVLKDKFESYDMPFIIGRAEWPTKIRATDSFFRSSTADIPGRMALDGIHLMKISFIGLTDYKLQTAAEEVLGETKEVTFDNMDKGEEIVRLYEEEPQKLVDYNLKDSKLVIDILEKKGLIEMTIQRSILTGMQLDRVNASIASLDNLYIKETKKRGYVCRTNNYQEREARIKGGYVRDSIPGIYDNIVVLDFKSLYPSIMRTFNIDPLAYIPKELHDKYDEKEIIISPNGAWFRKEPGILPEILERLWIQRDKAKKEKNMGESYAIKITMNSFFGVLANPNCRFYSLEMANAITHFGQFVVKKTAELTEDMGYVVIYGDTDSIFVKTDSEDEKKAESIGISIQDQINKFWKEHVKKKYGMKTYMELQFEKTYIRFMMPKIRGSEVGAKKRYAGLMMKDGKEKVDFRGLEFVRRDWTDLSKNFQLELLDRIFHKKEVVGFVKDFVEDLKKGKYDDLLIYRKAIRKDLDKYTKTTPPHVKAARKLDKMTSNIIAYVMTDEGPEPVQKIEHDIDYEHYVEKQIKPIADSVLVFYDTNFEDLLKNSKQTSLFSFG